MEHSTDRTEYILKQFDTELIKFELRREFDGLSAEIKFINEKSRHLLPLDLILSDAGLLKWLKSRVVPKNRAYVENFLAKLGLNEKDTKGILDISMGLSLTDSYWTPSSHFKGTFSEYNLFEHNFSKTISEIAFSGLGSFSGKGFTSSPEFTTNGVLAKCWRRVQGKILLYKSGSEGALNLGKEPFSEYYASQVAKVMGLNATRYDLSKWKSKLCSTCEIFTDINTSFIPVGSLVTAGGIMAVIDFYKKLGEDYYQDLVDMLVFDAVICNVDRHFGNFGVLVDNKTNKIKSFAPIFDNGLSLLCRALDEDLENIESYAQTRKPMTYPDFIEFAKGLITKRQIDKLKLLRGFKFQKHKKYNLNSKRLKILEEFVKNRAEELIG